MSSYQTRCSGYQYSFRRIHKITLRIIYFVKFKPLTMKRILLFAFLSSVTPLFAQTVKVTKETVKLKGEPAEGFEVILDGTAESVESQMIKYLKPVGKTKKMEDLYAISLPLINGKNYTSPVYAMVRDKGKGAAWIGIRPSEWPSSMDSLKNDMERMLYDFGVTFYRDKIQAQIDESNRALQAVERQQQKLVSQNKDLGTKLENNKQQKIELEKSLENNKLEFEALTKKIEQNKKDQDSVAFAGEQIRKVIEMQKDKQRNVN
jgi:hypothetical protein